MRIIQISDLHLTPDFGTSYDINVWANTQKLLNRIKEEKADLLVVNGDICCDTGDENTYKEVKVLLDQLPFPYEVIAGNHDDAKLVSRVFYGDEDHTFFEKRIQDVPLLFLDTSTYELTEPQWQYLMSNPIPSIIFMHHPPMIMGVPFMDVKHPLKDIEKFQNLLNRSFNKFFVFSGHIRTYKKSTRRNI